METLRKMKCITKASSSASQLLPEEVFPEEVPKNYVKLY